MKQCLMFLIAFYVSCDVYSSERFRVTVTDSEGSPVTNALVSLGFSAGNVVFAEGKSYNYEARTDTQGKAEIKFDCKSSNVGWAVKADGYYRSGPHKETFRIAVNPIPPIFYNVTMLEHEKEVKAMLWKRINPQPMYAYGMYESLKIRWPRENGRYGFDLRLFDWVAPIGKGEVADFYFVRNVVDGKPGECVGHLEFDDKCGAYVRKQTGSKSFPSTYGAETNAVFLSRFQFMFLNDKGAIDYGAIIGKDEYMVLRTRVKCDDNGNIKETNYSKILGPFGKGKGGVEAMETVFNPRVNDPNLELDSPKNFVKRNRSCAYPP